MDQLRKYFPEDDEFFASFLVEGDLDDFIYFGAYDNAPSEK
jgi:hypothetical protein